MNPVLSILVSTNRPYEYFAKRVVDALYKQDMSNNEIIICGTNHIDDPRIIFLKDSICKNGPQGYNQAAKISSGDYLAVLVDDHLPPNNINEISKFFKLDLFKNRKYKVGTFASGGTCYTGDRGLPTALMCRFPIMDRETYINLNKMIYHPDFNLKTPCFADHFLSIFLKINDCEGIEFPLSLYNFQHEKPEYHNNLYYEESFNILKRLVGLYKKGESFC